MTPEQLKSIIQHYKKRAAEENMLGYDLEKRNRLLKMARELEDNFEEYLEYEEDGLFGYAENSGEWHGDKNDFNFFSVRCVRD